MRFLSWLFVAIGIIALADPLVYVFVERWYRKNPEAEKTNSFELLDVVFRHKYAKVIYIAAGVIFIAAAVLIRVNF